MQFSGIVMTNSYFETHKTDIESLKKKTNRIKLNYLGLLRIVQRSSLSIPSPELDHTYLGSLIKKIEHLLFSVLGYRLEVKSLILLELKKEK